MMLIKSFIAIAALSSVSLFAFTEMKRTETPLAADLDQSREVMYLPDKDSVEALSFGYDNVLSDVLWFNTINYFGKHWHSDKDLRWLFHMCDLVTTLNPNALHVYEFGSTMLSWEQEAPEKSVELLTKAIESHPQNWKFYYLRGFTYMHFLKDRKAASKDFIAASKLPGSIPIVAALAGKTLAEYDDPKNAVAFLENLLQTNKDPAFQEAAQRRLLEAKFDLDESNWKKAMEIYRTQTGRNPTSLDDLVREKIVPSIPADPWGGHYSFDPMTGEVKASGKPNKRKGKH